MNRQYHYYAVVNERHPHEDDPVGVLRRWVDQDGQPHDESYSPDLAWVPTDDLVMLESGRSRAQARPITEETARRFEEVQFKRFHADNPADGKYDYLAWVDVDHPADDPLAVIRTWILPGGGRREQMYVSGVRAWRPSFVREDIGRGHVDGALVPITEEAAEQYQQAEISKRDAT
ncbi:hypothetical protein AB0M48_27575 [Lentzea sp. NPDC051208]|uniref:hypothetical protein n=1 Tax=Lentzea sp. NPDC051208 TaxID=3154642 RepID=UPI00341E9F1A